MSKYITMTMEEYEAMVAEIAELKRRKDRDFPAIDEIPFLGARLYAHLLRHGIDNVQDIENTRKSEWVSRPGFGAKSWKELQELMNYFGLHFREEE